MRLLGVRAARAVGRFARRRGGMLGGCAILGLLAWRLGGGPFVDALLLVNGTTLVAALLIGIATTVLSAWRWVLVARALGMRLSLRGAIGDYYRSLFLNSVLPGGVLGDVHRAVRHGRDIGDLGLAVKAVVLERTAGQIVLLVTGALVLAAQVPALLPTLLHTLVLPGRPVVAPLVGAVALAIALLAVLAARLSARWHGSGTAAGVVRAWAGDARQGLLSRGNRVGILLTSSAVLAGHLGMFVVAARAAGSTAPVGRLAPLLLLALMAMGLPISIGGWGPREAVTAWAFAAAGLNAAQGLTMALVYGLLALAASLPGAVVLVGQRIAGRRFAGRRFAGEAEGRRAAAHPARPRPVSGLVTVSELVTASGLPRRLTCEIS